MADAPKRGRTHEMPSWPPNKVQPGGKHRQDKQPDEGKPAADKPSDGKGKHRK